MKIIFSGNDYKYEIEAVMKLFFPAQHFEFVYAEKEAAELAADEDYVFARELRTKRKTLLYAAARIGGKNCRRVSSLTPNAAEGECELELSKLVYQSVSALTGIVSEWGIVTGVRPVKQVNRLIDKGLTKDEIFRTLQNDYLISPKKCSIAYDTAVSQAPFLKQLEESGGSTFGLYVSVPFCPSRCSYRSRLRERALRK